MLGTLAEENEDIITFAVSANQKLLVTATKNYMVKAYRMPEPPKGNANDIQLNPDAAEAWKPENVQTFRLVGTLALELAIDPSSRYVAVGTTDS